ncbi:bifunctional methylenetetrahydrofolate dehydrogenase/methenyltetrahydrofolate cyclohydrolase FolD [Prochlorococcus sp. MIT 1341]|uniref:bifunctional methylenetetrahydrofolate dehydrogenase/methenyltetrahydrofolate cyclohydrolase FolD n=1 Tax=Prochlorococcus sp. MIT 1341 TaxID=3096221 RepID=UPI002A750710|nr:bifunctional methylenetetrahydrofolate dehydrogenase/methenyltetrahydrofolate cyclohydrolase FolD [Prochlorococcus sp. MIT 1341]
MTLKLDGKKLASEIEERLGSEIRTHSGLAKRPPGLAVIRVGDDPASKVYVSNKEKACNRIGIENFGEHLNAKSTESEIIQKINLLNNDEKVDGILLQLPLPKHINEKSLLAHLSPEKDVDGLHSLNLGRLVKNEPGPRSCTPAGIMALLKANKVSIEGKNVVVIGRSVLVGKPMSLMLQAANATVTMAHSHTENLSVLTKQADILVVATGCAQMIGARHVKPGGVVIDVGIHRIEKELSKGSAKKATLCGDVRSEEVASIVSALTPVPGGVGPMTVTMLLVNTVNSWQQHCNLPFSLKDLLP